MPDQTTSLIIGIDASRAARGRRTGTETYSLELIKGLASLTTGRLRLRLYTAHLPQAAGWPDSDWVETRLIPWPRLWTHLRLAAELKSRPPAVLFVPAHVLPVYCPVPGVVTVHDLGYLHFPEAHRPLDRWYLHWSTRRHCQVAGHLIADSLATQRDLVSFYGADPRRITVVYLGRDERMGRVEAPDLLAEVRQRYNITGPYLLYLGTLHPRKNLVRLIEAFQQALPALPDSRLQLVIAGRRGWLYAQIFKRVEELGLTGRVIFPGYVDDADKAALLSGALAYVFPSLYEGFGLPVLEAMACGVPVLTSNTSSLPEVAGLAAVLVDPHRTEAIAGGIVRLVGEADLREQLVERGYRQVRRFSWAATAARVLEVLERVAKEENRV